MTQLTCTPWCIQSPKVNCIWQLHFPTYQSCCCCILSCLYQAGGAADPQNQWLCKLRGQKSPQLAKEPGESIWESSLGVKLDISFVQQVKDHLHTWYFTFQEMSRLQADRIETKELSTALQDCDPLADHFNPILMSFPFRSRMSMIPVTMAPSKIRYSTWMRLALTLSISGKSKRLPHALLHAIGKLYHHLMSISPQLQPLGLIQPWSLP